MASRALGTKAPAHWREVFRRSLLRSLELVGALAVFGLLVFLALALVSYQQTDPSGSTAAAGDVLANWMGRPGAWAADKLLMLFGLAAVLVLPLLWQFMRRLWLAVDGADAGHYARSWLASSLLLGLGMILLGVPLSLSFAGPGGSLPASMGGLSGLLGAGTIHALAGYLPITARFWAVLIAGTLCGFGGMLLAAKALAFEWARFFAQKRWRLAQPIANAPKLAAQPKAAIKPSLAALLPNRKPTEIADSSRPAAAAQLTSNSRQTDLFDAYELPGLDLLDDAVANTKVKVDKLGLERNARLLETVLDDFNVKGEITAVRSGPVVTMYELEPAPGIKASRVIGLADDIARNMSAISARVSSIPGRTVMGIELPNADRQMVSFKELIACEKFVSSKALLPIILGKDIAGGPVVADLAAMPHLLVAGTTGSGKSVGLNTILLSLLYRLTPAECRMILIDPKVLELKSYDDIPHLLSPVVTEPAKAVRALKWAVEEMERRYRQMSEIGVRNLSGFNDKIRTAAAKGKPLGRRIPIGFDPDSGEQLHEDQQLDYQVLPQIVVIVDELADLMVTVGKEIEVLIQRLSQKSRAAGIHLIMATQRPSVDVITGVIKANLPTRISFAVTSRIDSRTILGEQGAEQLLGKGDMLYKPSTDPVKRVLGPFVSDEEVERIATFWRGQGTPTYVTSVTEEPEDAAFSFDDLDGASDNPEDRKYRQVCQVVFESQKASTSWIQRHMAVGYNTAAKWIERMEADGLVGPANHVGRREVYRDKDGNAL